jgi:hypothetical protein
MANNTSLFGTSTTTGQVESKNFTTLYSGAANAIPVSVVGNTTYNIAAAGTTGGANLNLLGSDGSIDTVKFASSTQITATATDANTITLGLGTITLNELGDVVLSSPNQGQMLAYNGTDWVNSNNISFVADAYRPQFINSTGLSGANAALSILKNTGASSFTTGDGTGFSLGLINNTTVSTRYARLALNYDSGGNQLVKLQTSTAGVTNSGGSYDSTPLITSKNYTSLNSGQLYVDVASNQTVVKNRLSIDGSTSGYVNFESPAVATPQTYILPTDFPSTSGYVLSSTAGPGTGVMSWIPGSSVGVTYTQNISATTGGANLNLVGSDATTDTVKFANGTGITVSYTDASTATITNTGVTSAVAGTGVSVSAATGAVTFSIGQDVSTSASPTFNNLTLNGNTIYSNGGANWIKREFDGSTTIQYGVLTSYVQLDNLVQKNTASLDTTTTATNQVLDSFSKTTVRSAKYVVQISSGTVFQVVEILVIHDGTNPYATYYADLRTGANLTEFAVQISGGNCQLVVTPYNAVTKYRASVSYIYLS